MFKVVKRWALKIPFLRNYHNFRLTLTNIVPVYSYLRFRFLPITSINRAIYWPVHRNSEVTHPLNIYVGINSNAATRPGCYLQGNGGIHIGNYVHFASNIGIISGNHDVYDQMQHVTKEVRIDDYCWIGMGAIILPGVHLGKRTIVGAGSVVTKSFPEGFCVIAGNPAKVIKELEPSQFVPQKFGAEYYGYVSKDEFPKFAKRFLKGHRYYDEMVKIDD